MKGRIVLESAKRKKFTIKDIEVFLIGYSSLLIFVAIDNSLNMMMMLPVIICLIAIRIISKEKRVNNKKLFISLIFLALIYCISTIINLIINTESINSLSIIRIFYYLEIFTYIYLIISNSFKKSHIKKILKFNVNSSIIIACVLIFCFFYFGDIGKNSVKNIFGNYIEENYTAALLSFNSILLLYIVEFEDKNIVKLKYYLGLLILLYATFLSGSRASFFAIAISSLYFLVKKYIFTKSAITIKNIILIVILFSLLMMIIVNLQNILPEFIYNRFFNKSLNDYSNQTRLTYWKSGVIGFLKQPLLGYGVGNYSYFIPDMLKLNKTVMAHNTYLDILLDVGIIGFSFYLYLVFSNIKYILKNIAKFFPICFVLFFTSFIVGAERTYFFWHGVVVLMLVSNLYDNINDNQL